MEWQTVVGLEIHVQLLTASKLFSGSSTRYGADPNTQTSFIDAALPGVLPVLNKKAVEFAIRLGLALGATINRVKHFRQKKLLLSGFAQRLSDLAVRDSYCRAW